MPSHKYFVQHSKVNVLTYIECLWGVFIVSWLRALLELISYTFLTAECVENEQFNYSELFSQLPFFCGA